MKNHLNKFVITMIFIIFTGSALAAANAPKAIAVLMPTQGSQVSGIVTFTQTPEGIEVEADVTGLSSGKHGFHIHEFGDCSAPDAASAGGHFNPQDMHHAGPQETDRHVGDLGNIDADAKGKAHYQRLDKMLSFTGENNIIGYSVIVHANQDDLKTQPTGDAGGRVACGVIGIAKP